MCYELKRSFWEGGQQLIKLKGLIGSSPRVYKLLHGERGLFSGAPCELYRELQGCSSGSYHSLWGGLWVIQLLKSPFYSCRESLTHAAVSLINSFVCQTRLGWTCSFAVGTLCDLNRCLPISPWKSSTAVWLVFLYRVYNGKQNTCLWQATTQLISIFLSDYSAWL